MPATHPPVPSYPPAPDHVWELIRWPDGTLAWRSVRSTDRPIELPGFRHVRFAEPVA